MGLDHKLGSWGRADGPLGRSGVEMIVWVRIQTLDTAGRVGASSAWAPGPSGEAVEGSGGGAEAEAERGVSGAGDASEGCDKVRLCVGNLVVSCTPHYPALTFALCALCSQKTNGIAAGTHRRHGQLAELCPDPAPQRHCLDPCRERGTLVR